MKLKKTAVENKYILIAGAVVLVGAAYMLLRKKRTIPKGVTAVTNFKLSKYLGKWFEIARLEYFWEKNLEHVTAEYSLNNDGTIKVVNRGYNFKKNKEEESTGKARFVGNETIAELKVSFFGPFYAGYNVIVIDEDYQYALVSGDNRDYLWLLSRTNTMPEKIKNEYLGIAYDLGFAVEDLVWTKQA